MRVSRQFLASAIAALAIIAFTAGVETGCSSSSTPTATPAPVVAPKPAPVAAPAAKPTGDQQEAKVNTAPAGEYSATRPANTPLDAKPLPITADPKSGGLLVKDVPVPAGVAVDAEKTATDPKTGLATGTVTVHPFDPKKPLKCTPAVKDHCVENKDGSIAVSLDKKPGS